MVSILGVVSRNDAACGRNSRILFLFPLSPTRLPFVFASRLVKNVFFAVNAEDTILESTLPIQSRHGLAVASKEGRKSHKQDFQKVY